MGAQCCGSESDMRPDAVARGGSLAIGRSDKIKIHYFGLRGRADVLVQLCEYKKVPYEKVVMV